MSEITISNPKEGNVPEGGKEHMSIERPGQPISETMKNAAGEEVRPAQFKDGSTRHVTLKEYQELVDRGEIEVPHSGEPVPKTATKVTEADVDASAPDKMLGYTPDEAAHASLVQQQAEAATKSPLAQSPSSHDTIVARTDQEVPTERRSRLKKWIAGIAAGTALAGLAYGGVQLLDRDKEEAGTSVEADSNKLTVAIGNEQVPMVGSMASLEGDDLLNAYDSPIPASGFSIGEYTPKSNPFDMNYLVNPYAYQELDQSVSGAEVLNESPGAYLRTEEGYRDLHNTSTNYFEMRKNLGVLGNTEEIESLLPDAPITTRSAIENSTPDQLSPEFETAIISALGYNKDGYSRDGVMSLVADQAAANGIDLRSSEAFDELKRIMFSNVSEYQTQDRTADDQSVDEAREASVQYRLDLREGDPALYEHDVEAHKDSISNIQIADVGYYGLNDIEEHPEYNFDGGITTFLVTYEAKAEFGGGDTALQAERLALVPATQLETTNGEELQLISLDSYSEDLRE